MFVDSHCHLADPSMSVRLPEVLTEMQQAGVSKALCICTTLEEFETVDRIAAQHGHVWATVGVHPDNEGVREPDVQTLVALSARPRVVALGETGLDYFRLGTRSVADMAWQRDRFGVHIQAALQTQLPLVIHTRSASSDTLGILQDQGQHKVTGVFHCFTESMAVARAALDLGFYISFSGILTFKNATELREVAQFVPLDRCLIETDSPYLAPMPHRGKPNQPAWVAYVAQQLADTKGCSVEDIAQHTTANFEHLFLKPRGF
jgi:TatD DNase family protein